MGTSKALVVFEGEPLLTRALRRARAISHELIVVAQDAQALPPVEGARVVRDPVRDEGPLVGLATGLAHVDPATPWVFVTTTDAPWVQAAVVLRLFALREGCRAVVPSIGDKPHVLSALYRREAETVAESLVASGERRASALARALDARYVSRDEILADERVRAEDPLLRTFENLNTPDDLARARGQREG